MTSLLDDSLLLVAMPQHYQTLDSQQQYEPSLGILAIQIESKHSVIFNMWQTKQEWKVYTKGYSPGYTMTKYLPLHCTFVFYW